MDEKKKKLSDKNVPLPPYNWGGTTPGWEKNTKKVARLGEINKLLTDKERENQLE